MRRPVILPPGSNRRLCFFPPDTMVRICLTISMTFLLAIETASAQSTAPTEENELPILDSTQEQASTMILSAADWMDDFF